MDPRVQPPPVKALYYARRSPHEPPFLVAVDATPYVFNPNDPAPIVELYLPPGSQAQPIAGALPPAYPGVAPIQSGSNVSICSKILSTLFCLGSAGNSIGAFVMFILTMTNSLPQDYFYRDGLGLAIASLCLYTVALIMRLSHFFSACSLPPQVTGSEKFSLVVSVFCPPLKYFMAALTYPETALRLKGYRSTDFFANLCEIVSAGLMIGAYNNSRYYCYNYYYDWCYYDPILLIFSIQLFCNCLCDFPIVYLIHANFVKKTILKQEQMLIGVLGQNLLPNQQPQQPYGMGYQGQVVNTANNPALPGYYAYQAQPGYNAPVTSNNNLYPNFNDARPRPQ